MSRDMRMIGARGGNATAAKAEGTDYYQRTGRMGGSYPKRRKSRVELECAMAARVELLNMAKTSHNTPLLRTKERARYVYLLRERVRYYRRKLERCKEVVT